MIFSTTHTPSPKFTCPLLRRDEYHTNHRLLHTLATPSAALQPPASLLSCSHITPLLPTALPTVQLREPARLPLPSAALPTYPLKVYR